MIRYTNVTYYDKYIVVHLDDEGKLFTESALHNIISHVIKSEIRLIYNGLNLEEFVNKVEYIKDNFDISITYITNKYQELKVRSDEFMKLADMIDKIIIFEGHEAAREIKLIHTDNSTRFITTEYGRN